MNSHDYCDICYIKEVGHCKGEEKDCKILDDIEMDKVLKEGYTQNPKSYDLIWRERDNLIFIKHKDEVFITLKNKERWQKANEKRKEIGWPRITTNDKELNKMIKKLMKNETF